MSIMTNLVETEPSYFSKVVEKPVWVDAMVEKYESNEKNNVCEVVPRLVHKSVVGSRWMFKVKHEGDIIIEKYKAIFMENGTLKLTGLTMRGPFLL